MSGESVKFPFSAVCGMDDVKTALMCAAVNPGIGPVLIRGGSGVAKTTLARSMGGITGKNVVNIPINTSEDQVFGGLDMETAMKTGEIRLQPGLMARTDRNIAYMDDVNLFDGRILSSILECVLTGTVRVERGQISANYDCDTMLIATMNPNDADLSLHILDRFDLCVYANTESDREIRDEILRRNMDFADDPKGFNNRYAKEEMNLHTRLERAKMILPSVVVTDELSEIISELCFKIGADGYRGDIAVTNTAMALAALDDRDEVNRTDVETASRLCLSHRRDYSREPPQKEEPSENNEESQNNEEQPENNDGNNEEQSEDSPNPPQKEEQPENNDGNNEEQSENEDNTIELPSVEDMIFAVGEQFRVLNYLKDDERLPTRTKSRKGRRGMTESCDMTGRYVGSRFGDDALKDVAFDATVRAAAPYQNSRDKKGLAVSIEKRDLRKKIRERQSGCTLMFLVDASGSLGVRKRMATVKGAILSMLKESYVKRDRIGMMAFRRDSAEMILPPTKSVEYSYRKLEELPTGGKTPLGEALVSVREYMTSYSRCHPGERCFIILITDGRANVPLKEGADANAEVRNMAEDMVIPGVGWIIVDAGQGYMKFDNAMQLAEKLGGRYFRLEDLNADRLVAGLKYAII